MIVKWGIILEYWKQVGNGLILEVEWFLNFINGWFLQQALWFETLISAHCNTFRWTVKEIPSFVNVPLDMLFNLIYF